MRELQNLILPASTSSIRLSDKDSNEDRLWKPIRLARLWRLMKFIPGFAGDRTYAELNLTEEPFRQFNLDRSVIPVHLKRLSQLSHFFENVDKIFIFHQEKENVKPRTMELSSKSDTFCTHVSLRSLALIRFSSRSLQQRKSWKRNGNAKITIQALPKKIYNAYTTNKDAKI